MAEALLSAGMEALGLDEKEVLAGGKAPTRNACWPGWSAVEPP
jgi:hypothetical protein